VKRNVRWCERPFHSPTERSGNMGDKGKRDKGKKEVQKKAKLTLMEKRKQKNEKKKEK
jgi:hypothetical protein